MIKTKLKKSVYECETCHRKSENKTTIEKCEKTHECKHKNKQYYQYDTGDVFDTIVGIDKICLDCGKQLDSVSLSEIEYPEHLKQLFKLMKKYTEEENNY